MDSSIAETSKQNPETSRDSSMAEPAQDQSIGDPSKENPETSLQMPEPPKQNPETPKQKPEPPKRKPETPKQNPEPPKQNPEFSKGWKMMRIGVGVAKDKNFMLRKMVEALEHLAKEAWIQIDETGLLLVAKTRVKSHSTTLQISPNWFSYFKPYGKFYGHSCLFNISQFSHIIKFPGLNYEHLLIDIAPKRNLGPCLQFKFINEDAKVARIESLNVLWSVEIKHKLRNIMASGDLPDTFKVHMNPGDFISVLEKADENNIQNVDFKMSDSNVTFAVGEDREAFKRFLLKESGPRVVPVGKSFNCNISLCGFEAKYLRSLSPVLHVMTVRIADPDVKPNMPFILEIPLDKDNAAKLWLWFHRCKYIKEDVR